MGEQKKFRSDAARKNYEKVERQRAQAIKRKENQAKQAAWTANVLAWLKQNPKQTLLAVAALVAVIVLVCVGCKAAFDPLKHKQDNWLILDVSANSSHDYRHLADFNIPRATPRMLTPSTMTACSRISSARRMTQTP